MKVFDLSNPDLYFLIVLTILNSLVLCFLSNKFLQILQLSGYKISPYGAWLKDTKAKWFGRLTLLCFLSFCGVFVTNILFNKFLDSKLFGNLGLIFYFAFAIVFIIEIHKIPQKKPLKVTKRMFRIYVALYVLYAVITFFALALSLSYSFYLRMSVITITPLIVPVLAPLALLITHPLEKIIQNGYKHRCKVKLTRLSNLIKIGITGSFGKTSTKAYLKAFLESKYKVCATPSSFNTPMGISKVVLDDLNEDDEVFIAEMGAKKMGEIKELCEMVLPDAGIITSVGEQHLESFKNLENIIKTKSELYENLPKDAVCVFNVSNKHVKKMFDACKLKNKTAVGKNGTFLYEKDIIATTKGLEFKLCYDGKEYQTKTSILGEHNVQNILSAAALALKLGVSIKQILKVIPTLKTAEHRLELKNLDNDIIIIDDSFNSNIQGTAVALETLKLFEENRKIVVTPGLVELGKIENEENIELGKRIASSCDIAILVGKNQSENIKKGLLKKGFDEKNIIVKDTLFEVTNLFKTLLQSGDVVLLENDLPDNYK
ncbi:MAG TPA: UDP-N-acetylmuramoyl-tripeptide--D-alanyl-D-alanine ligase [Clostridiales bacterium]|nr:UDP-N-acetylmuramoyl-tripeptide--D-alanyl-D-alanine ligase [Clostridiales bacterium]